MFIYKVDAQQWLPTGFLPTSGSARANVTSAAWRPLSGDMLAVGTSHGQVHLWTVDMTGHEPPLDALLWQVPGQPPVDAVTTLAWSPTGRYEAMQRLGWHSRLGWGALIGGVVRCVSATRRPGPQAAGGRQRCVVHAVCV